MKTLEITYTSESSSEAVLSKVILETKAKINILKADIGEDKGVMIINVDGSESEATKVVKVFRKYGVKVREIKKKISVDRKLCVDCGACVSLCPVNALELDNKSKLKILEDACIQCNACVIACPMKALSIEE